MDPVSGRRVTRGLEGGPSSAETGHPSTGRFTSPVQLVYTLVPWPTSPPPATTSSAPSTPIWSAPTPSTTTRPRAGRPRSSSLPPSRHYLTGFLVPEEEREPDDPSADDSLGAGSDEPEEESRGEEPEDKRKNLWPASIGLSVLLPREARAVKATVRFAEYVPETIKPEGGGRGRRVWKRTPRQTLTAEVPLDPRVLEKGIPLPNAVRLVLFGRVRAVEHARGLADGTQALALFVVNQRGAGIQGRRDEQMIFQVELEIECAEGIVRRPDFSSEESDQWDQKVSDLQFREHVEYAVGHGVAVEVPPGQEPVTRVKTTWLPPRAAA